MSGPTQPTEQHFDKGSWAWNGTLWVKQPLIFGYSSRWVEEQYTLTAAAGVNLLTTVAVPSGYSYRVDMVTGVDLDNAASIGFYALGGGVGVTFSPYEAMTAGALKVVFPVGIWLAAGDNLNCVFAGCTLNDDLYFRTWGVKMAIG